MAPRGDAVSILAELAMLLLTVAGAVSLLVAVALLMGGGGEW